MQILTLIENIDLNRLIGIQLLFENEQTVEFCNARGFLDKSFLFPHSNACAGIASNSKYLVEAVQMLFDIDFFRDLSSGREEAIFMEALVMRSDRVYLFSEYAVAYCAGLLRAAPDAKPDVRDYLELIINHGDMVSEALSKVMSQLPADRIDCRPIEICIENMKMMAQTMREFMQENRLVADHRNFLQRVFRI